MEKEAAEKERRAHMEGEIAIAKEEAEEQLRRAQEQWVPREPLDTGVLVAVRHVDLGVLTRSFPLSCTMSAVYNWIGSLSLSPKIF